VHDDEVLQVAKDIVYTHHERWMARATPRGLRGQAIPVSGRLVALVDAHDAMVTTRAYRDGVPHEAAVEAVVSGRGTHFDPDLVEAFLTVHEQFRAAASSTAEGRPEGRSDDDVARGSGLRPGRMRCQACAACSSSTPLIDLDLTFQEIDAELDGLPATTHCPEACCWSRADHRPVGLVAYSPAGRSTCEMKRRT
jgi:hypothetical protein